MKKLIIVSIMAAFASTCLASHSPGPAPHQQAPRPMHQPPPSRQSQHCQPPCHHSHHDEWIVPVVLGSAVLGSAVINAANCPKTVVIRQTPAVVQQPIATTPVIVQPQVKIWIEGRYVDQVQTNGITLRVWQPGHWEYL